MVALALFAVAAVGGLVLAIQRFRNKPLNFGLAIVHGLVAATALVLVLLAVAKGTAPALAKPAAAGFVVAALGGFVLFSFQLRKQQLPIPIMVIHALVAVASFVTLAVAVLA